MAYTDSGLSEDKRLVWAGLKQPKQDQSPVAKYVDLLREEIPEFDDFATDVEEDVDDFGELEDYFDDNGFSADEAEEFTQHIENDYEEFEDFEDYVDSVNSYDGFQNGFGTTATFGGERESEDGAELAAIKVHDDGGISRNGEVLPEGTVEIIGQRIEFSQSDPPRAEDGDITVDNFTTDAEDEDNVVDNLTFVEMSADVENTNSGNRRVTVSLTKDGDVVDEKTLDVDANSTETVSFLQSGSDECANFAIEDAGLETVCWVYPGLIF